MKRAPRLPFDANLVIHGSPNPLLAAEIAFSCLHGNVPEKELDLIQVLHPIHGTASRTNASDHVALRRQARVS